MKYSFLNPLNILKLVQLNKSDRNFNPSIGATGLERLYKSLQELTPCQIVISNPTTASGGANGQGT
jgi:hypothetical protein